MKFSFNRISWKLLIVSASFTLPIAVMLNLMVKAKQKDIDFAAWELKGNSYQRPLEKLLKTVSLHRWHTARTLLGDTSSATTITALEQGFGPQFAELQAAQAQYGLDLQFEPTGLAKRQRLEFTVEGFKTKWDKLMSSKASLTVDESELQHKALVAHLKTMITHAGDTSNLILDPDLDSYYLMDVTLLAQPQLQDRLQEIASFTERMYAKGSMNADERLQASVFSSFLREADLDRATASTQTALNEDQNFYGLSPSLQTNLLAGSKAHVDAVT
ncbi:MAG: hypothetical protein NTV34_05240, partial [Proteobacteria bacterium]|nr:hypothetical protein [Pseudomonadota bacterium]